MNTKMVDFIHEMKRHWNERKENPLRGALFLCFIADKVVLEHPEYKACHKELRDTIFSPVFGPYNAIDQVVLSVLQIPMTSDTESHCNRIREWWLNLALECATEGDPLPRFPLTYANWQKLWEHTK